MKIRKLIKEAVDDEVLTDINPQEASVAEIADAVQNSVEDLTDDEATLTDANAKKVAAEIKDTAQDVDAAQAVVLPAQSDVVEEAAENTFTKTLDRAFAAAKRNMRRGSKTGANVLVSGLPGSGKTAIFYAWAARNNVNVKYLDAKNPYLETALNGMPLRDITAKDKNVVANAYSNTLAPLHRPNSVLFLDELNRQVKPHIRASLLTLINEKEVSGEDETGHESFKDTLLFTVACINPAVPTDRGAVELNDAEKSRFIYQIKNFDSSPTTALDYYDKHYSYLVKKLIAEKDSWIKKHADEFKCSETDAEKAWEAEVEAFLKIKDMAVYIVSHPLFSFDTRDDLEALYDEHAEMFNQRALTDAVENCDGDKTAFLEWLDENCGFLQKDIDMLRTILESYVVNLADLKKAVGISTDDTEEKPAATPNEPEVEEDEEDDDDFFQKTPTSGAAKSANVLPSDVQSAIQDIVATW